MQWTMQRITAEICQVDAQVISYLERCELQGVPNMEHVKRIRKWYKQHTPLFLAMLSEIHLQFPDVASEIAGESAGEEPQVPPHSMFDDPRYRDSAN